MLDSFAGEMADYTVEREYPEHDLLVLADMEYFSQAIHNIIRNALDAMQSLPPERHHLACQIRAADNWVLLLIRDQGTGIHAKNLEHIFQPFFSSHPFSRNWGIGLSLTYKIIVAHDGKIEVDSIYGEGTTVKIMLPGVDAF